ncbi:hypothetical protein BZA77DRAFT_313802 [Pyronema omphalodes]|nr:hypothetical protein BZA77DRAFT_313802 [Pyronema omphalodes]
MQFSRIILLAAFTFFSMASAMPDIIQPIAVNTTQTNPIKTNPITTHSSAAIKIDSPESEAAYENLHSREVTTSGVKMNGRCYRNRCTVTKCKDGFHATKVIHCGFGRNWGEQRMTICCRN